MNKVIKIQTNLGISSSYNADNIEAVFCGDTSQEISYQIVDEYTLPLGTYLNLRNYDDILFDKATCQTTEHSSGSDSGNDSDSGNESSDQKVYYIIEKDKMPDYETMEYLFYEYIHNNSDCKGIVVIDKSQEVYNEVQVSFSNTPEGIRITDINLDGEYFSLNEAIETLNAENPVVFDFNELYPAIAKYWKTRSSNNTKTSAFDCTSSLSSNECSSLKNLLSFESGFGTYTEESIGSGSGAGYDIYNLEYWIPIDERHTSSSGTSSSIYTIPNGKYYLSDDGSDDGSGSQHSNSIKVKDYNYNIFDVLFRYIYSYVYTYNEDSSVNVEDPSNYTFLLKTYKMYVKNTSINSSSRFPYSVDILSNDEIKKLSSSEAQEYFNNTIVHNNLRYRDKLILNSNEAKDILVDLNITSFGNYFLISDNVGIQCPSSQQYNYYDLGNFELVRELNNLFGITKNIYKYSTNGKIIKLRNIYDPYTYEYRIVSQDNSGNFSNSYFVERKGVCIRNVSGKCDYYYYENTNEGSEQAEQLKEDILYAMEEGPSIVTAESLVDIKY